jgi:hypothetical protein
MVVDDSDVAGCQNIVQMVSWHAAEKQRSAANIVFFRRFMNGGEVGAGAASDKHQLELLGQLRERDNAFDSTAIGA